MILARDGHEAKKLFESNKGLIDLLILDIVMPGIGGYELYKKFLLQFSNIPTIFITGYSDEKLDEKLTNGKFVTIFSKPFSPDYIVHKVREILDRFKKTESS